MLQFDIRAVLKQKAPKAHVPGFLIRYLERIAHIKPVSYTHLTLPTILLV